MDNDPQVGFLKICERCGHIFDGFCCGNCPQCGTEFVRKYRQSDLDRIRQLRMDRLNLHIERLLTKHKTW